LDLLSARLIQWKLREVFDELYKKYLYFMDIIAEVASSSGQPNSSDLLRAYERWLRTNSQRDKRLLEKGGLSIGAEKKSGIIPLKVSTKIMQ